MDETTRTGERKPSRNVRGQMLPGIAGISMFMMFMTMVNVYAALTGVYGRSIAKYGVLTLCTLLAVGIFGLLRLRKWGWALVSAGCLLFATGYFYYFSKVHVGFFLVQGLFGLLFFLYLVRSETRERLF
jgi:drug/metabolite transporter (DMT)-like permease